MFTAADETAHIPLVFLRKIGKFLIFLEMVNRRDRVTEVIPAQFRNPQMRLARLRKFRQKIFIILQSVHIFAAFSVLFRLGELRTLILYACVILAACGKKTNSGERRGKHQPFQQMVRHANKVLPL